MNVKIKFWKLGLVGYDAEHLKGPMKTSKHELHRLVLFSFKLWLEHGNPFLEAPGPN